MFAFRSRALTYSSRALLARRTNTTLSDAHKGKAPPPGTPEGERHTHHHEPPTHHEEGFSKSFYVSIAAAVGCLALYKLEQSISGANSSPLTRAIEYYSDLTKDWEERNNRHTVMVERAAADRNLFENSKPSKTINLRFPEQFNSGSPFLNEIGWRGNDLAALQEHYDSTQKERK